MKKGICSFVFTIVSLVFATNLVADHVRNGGGTAERHFTYALHNLGAYISIGLSESKGRFTNEERAMLTQISDNLSIELRNEGILDFRSESESPGFFMLDGAVRVAKTGSQIGDTIFINRDLIYTQINDRWVSMTIPECIPILVHELGHHLGDWSHNNLDLLGIKLQAAVGQNIIVDEFDPTLTVLGDDISMIKSFPTLTAIEFSSDTSKSFDSRLFVSDSFGTYDLTNSVISGIIKLGDIEGLGANKTAGLSCWGSDFDSSERRGWRFSQFHLASPRWTYAATVKPGVFVFFIKAALSIECIDRSGSRMVDPGLDMLQMVFLETDGDSIRFKFLDSPELQNSMTLINDDDDYKLAAIMRVLLLNLFGSSN